MAKKVLVLLSILFITLIANSQATIYQTFKDYQDNKGELVGEYHTYRYFGGKVKLIFKKGKKKNVINCGEIWGFKYNESLFRMDQKNEQPALVENIGKIIYYENGLGHLELIKEGEIYGEPKKGYYCFLSKDLSSDLLPITIGRFESYRGRKNMRKFVGENPEYKALFECFENALSKHIKRCVWNFEGYTRFENLLNPQQQNSQVGIFQNYALSEEKAHLTDSTEEKSSLPKQILVSDSISSNNLVDSIIRIVDYEQKFNEILNEKLKKLITGLKIDNSQYDSLITKITFSDINPALIKNAYKDYSNDDILMIYDFFSEMSKDELSKSNVKYEQITVSYFRRYIELEVQEYLNISE